MNTPTIGEERLRTLYSIMAGIPAEKVHMKNWRGWSTMPDETLIHNCGTAACAVGWACAYPEFQEHGLDYVSGMPFFAGESNWLAVQKFFGLSHTEAQAMFMVTSVGLVAKLGVLRRIRRHLLNAGVINELRNQQLILEEEGITS